ncbi:MAG: tetratricopeptide repeat protein [Nitrospiria bacterium]
MCHIEKRKDRSKQALIEVLTPLILLVLTGCGGVLPVRGEKIQSLETRQLGKKTVLPEDSVVRVAATKSEIRKRYQRFLEKHENPASPLRAPALKRLGDLYMGEARERFLEEMAGYELQPEGPPPVVDYRQAMEPYRELLRDYPDYRQNDQVLYALSRAYAETGNRAQALPLLERLVKKYPDSPHRLEAYFRLGEYYFDRRDYESAAKAYAHAASWEDPYFQDKARYKLGWTFFKLKKYTEAVYQFLNVIDQKTAEMTVFSPEEGSLVWEALTYVANSFRHLGGASAAVDYFQKNGARRYENTLYLMMGNHYMVEGTVHLGIETYNAFIAAHPTDPMNPFFATYVIEAFQKLGDRTSAEAARIRLVQDYAAKSHWYKKNDDAVRARSRPLIQSELHRLALSVHASAQANEEAADYQNAARWYRQYLSEFPDAEAAREIHFLLGETLMSLHAYADAGDAYETAAYGQSEDKPDRKAAYAAVVAYEKVKTPAGKTQFIALSDRFVNAFPKDPQAPTVLINAAEFLFTKADYRAAVQRLEKFLLAYPQHPTASIARTKTAHSHMKAGDFAKARIAYREALLHLPKANKEERKKLSELLAAAIYKTAILQKEKGKIESAAGLFQDVSKSVSWSDLAPEALFEAGLLYEQLKQPETAIQVYRKISQNYEKSTHAVEAALRAGLLYEKSGKRLQSAAMFVFAAKRSTDEQQAQNLLWRAALHYEKLENWDKVVTTFLIFIQRFPKHDDVPEGLFKMAEARQKQGRLPAAAKLYQAVITRGEKNIFTAKSRFWQAERSFNSFKSIALKAPLAKKLKQKTKALKEVVSLYSKSLKTGHASVAAASAHRLGEVFEHFQTALLHAEQPKNLSEEQLEEYRFQLEEKAYPFEEKAIKAYESNVHRAQKNAALYNAWVRKSYGRLADLRPVRYRRTERTEQIVSSFNGNLQMNASDFFNKTLVQAK